MKYNLSDLVKGDIVLKLEQYTCDEIDVIINKSQDLYNKMEFERLIKLSYEEFADGMKYIDEDLYSHCEDYKDDFNSYLGVNLDNSMESLYRITWVNETNDRKIVDRKDFDF